MITNILGAYSEDIHFPNGTTPTNVDTNSGRFRAGYARFAIDNRANFARTLSLVGGAVISAWASARAYAVGAQTSNMWFGLGLNASGNKGVCIGTDSSSSTKLAIVKYDGSTRTSLATESGTSLTTGSIIKLDLQVTGNSGLTSCTLTAYVNSTQVATVSSIDLSALFATLDCFILGSNGGGNFVMSEFIVADGDTRTLSVVTHAPTAAGSANNWTGAYTDISENVISDATLNFVNTTAQSVQYNVNDLPSGTFAVKSVSIASRMAISGANVPTGVKLGLLISATEYLDSAHTLTSTFTTYERLMTTSPATSAAFSMSEINAMQLDHQSA